jgi:heptosyltransferase-1
MSILTVFLLFMVYAVDRVYRYYFLLRQDNPVVRRILIVKLSSLGDVIHNIPMVYDLNRLYPEAEIDWVVEEAYVDLIRPLTVRPISIGLRRWLKGLKRGRVFFREIVHFYRNLRGSQYDLIIDSQGLIKSAVVAWLAKKPGGKIVGLANRTIDSYYEFPVRSLYDECMPVTPKTHDVDRSRWLALGQKPADTSPQFYPPGYVQDLTRESNPLNLTTGSYVLFFHATADVRKAWSPSKWIELGHHMNRAGYTVVLPWGSPAEHDASLTIAKGLVKVLVPPPLGLLEFYRLIAQAGLTVGVDTGLTHLAAALNRPTVEIYVQTFKWKTCGYWESTIVNTGDKGAPPTVQDILADLSASGFNINLKCGPS